MSCKKVMIDVILHFSIGCWRRNMSWEDYFVEIYYDPANAGSFWGPEKLHRYVHKEWKYVLGKYNIRKWLQRQDAYSLQQGVRRRFKRNKVITFGIDDHWDVDLVDMSKYAKENNGVSFILVVIDIFFQYLWMRPLKNKKGHAERYCSISGYSPGRSSSNQIPFGWR